MSVLTWKEEYSVHIAAIDEQHKQLVGMINMLHDAMSEGKGKAVLDRLLGKLVAYTQNHFAAEEGLMRHHGYPGYEEHKAKHDRMTARVLTLQKTSLAGKASISFDVADFLQDWLKKHILGTDKKYCTFLSEKGVR